MKVISLNRAHPPYPHDLGEDRALKSRAYPSERTSYTLELPKRRRKKREGRRRNRGRRRRNRGKGGEEEKGEGGGGGKIIPISKCGYTNHPPSPWSPQAMPPSPAQSPHPLPNTKQEDPARAGSKRRSQGTQLYCLNSG